MRAHYECGLRWIHDIYIALLLGLTSIFIWNSEYCGHVPALIAGLAMSNEGGNTASPAKVYEIASPSGSSLIVPGDS